jgi:hypothetical protein
VGKGGHSRYIADNMNRGALMFARPILYARAGRSAAGLLLTLALLAACAQPPSATPPTATQSAQPDVTATSASPASSSQAATATTALPAETQIPPRTDPETPTPVEAARLGLAAQLGLRPNEVTVLSEGPWTTDPVPCQLDLPGTAMDRLLQGEHKLVTLSAKGRHYEFWVFASVGGLPAAFPCASAS